MRLFSYLVTLFFGCLVGILWAPRKGATLRAEILDHFLEMKEEGEEIARGAIEKGKEIKEIAEDGLGKASDSILQAKMLQ